MELLILVFQNLFAFTIILSVVVFVHEFGHYIVAKKCGVKIESFSIGFGKEIFGWNDKSGTRWKFSILPFGGYVKMFGDEDPSSSKKDKEKLSRLSKKEKKQTLYFQNVYKRMVIVFAGPFFNLLFAVLILTASFRISGISYFEPIVDEVVQGSVAEKSNIMKGDLIKEVNGKKIHSFEDVKTIISLNLDKNINIGLMRNSKYVIIDLKPEITKTKDAFGNDITVGTIGIVSSTENFEKANLVKCFLYANKITYKICINTLKALGQIIVGQRSFGELGGPLKIAKYSGQSFKRGFGMVMWFIAMISANLGLMNLLPIPILDGGHLFFYLVEAIRRKPISEKIQAGLFKMGFIFLVGLMIFATINDIISII